MGTLTNGRVTTLLASLFAVIIIMLNLYLLYQIFFGH
jgi:Mn2+/Fe2+ NRAMP family transporter